MRRDMQLHGTEPGVIRCLTPLYNFASDTRELPVAEGIRVSQYDSQDLTDLLDEVIGVHLQVCEPDYLLWNDPVHSGDVCVENISAMLDGRKWGELTEVFLASTTQLFRVLRLFKPGHLRAGETFLVCKDDADGVEYWRTLSSGRASTARVDYQRIASEATTYALKSVELPFLLAFRESVMPALRLADSVPALNLALNLYGADDGEELNAVNTVTALEALLSKKEENEGLTYRLSMRAANLLGHNVEDRKRIFGEIKSFYNLRSKIVHGVQLDGKQLNRLNELSAFREMLRRVLLSAMALLSRQDYIGTLPDLLDELAFDNEKRDEVQAMAGSFLHIRTPH